MVKTGRKYGKGFPSSSRRSYKGSYVRREKIHAALHFLCMHYPHDLPVREANLQRLPENGILWMRCSFSVTRTRAEQRRPCWALVPARDLNEAGATDGEGDEQ